MPDDALSPHFTLAELSRSDTALRLGIDNTPGQTARDNLKKLALGLEAVRAILGNKPIRINSGYRSEVLNKRVGGSANSAHLHGLAADFVCPDFGSPRQIAEKLASHAAVLQFDQLIEEGTWVHVAFPPFAQTARRQVLTARFVEGKAIYTPGLA